MNKEVLEKLLAIMKETSPQDLWDQIKELEEKLESLEESIEGMEQLVVDMISEDSKFLSEAKEVAKTKGLPEPDGESVRKFMSASFSASVADEVQTKGSRNKKSPKDYAPTEEELSLINELSNVDLSKEDVFVFTLRSAGQDIDRSFDQFTSKALKDMADMSKDKPFLKDHSWDTESVIGKIFDAKVGEKQLIQKVYVPITEKNKDMINGIMTGIYNKVSVGFAMEPMQYACSSCNKSLYSRDCSHYPGEKDAGGNLVVGVIKGVSDYFEISNVAVPAQPAAGIRRSLTAVKSVHEIADPSILSEESTVKMAERIENLMGIPPVKEPETPIEVSVDKIVNDNSDGDDPVEQEPATLPETEVEQKDVEAPAETKAVEPEAVVKTEDAILSLLKEMIAKQGEVLEAIKAISEVKAKVENDESTEDIVRKLAATNVSIPGAPSVDMTKRGWGRSALNALFTTEDNNQ
jgi:regulator of replication initiation timing